MKPRAAVIGTVFMDCKGFARQLYDPYGRNLGSIKFVHGGVGRNVAQNLSLLNLEVFFVSTIDDSALGEEVARRLRQTQVNLDYLGVSKSHGMGLWLALLDQQGDLAGSISQMPDLTLLQEMVDNRGQEIMERVSHVVLEIDLNAEIAKKVIKISRQHNKPVYGIPGNLDVVLKHRDLLSHIECFICNDVEAGRLIGKNITGSEINEVLQELKALVKREGLPSMVITLGPRGSVYADSRTGDEGYQPAFETRVVDSSGAGDAFFSGTVAGLIRRLPLREAVVLGSKVASWTIQVEENTCFDIRDRLSRDDQLLARLRDTITAPRIAL
ncbi:MAG: carbohydrate kinase family protein [Syntrophomonadales bacterium]|jgi:pseudouridine kinase